MGIFLIVTIFSFVVFGILFFLFCAYRIVCAVIPMIFYGAVFASSTPEIIEKMMVFANIKTGEKTADIGSGDGRLVIAMAKRGAEAHGYEINPLLVWLSRRNIKKAGLNGQAFIHWKNLWRVDFSEFSVVTVYGISYMMKKLETKLKKELKPGARVVSKYFTFPSWPYSKKEDNIYLYIV